MSDLDRVMQAMADGEHTDGDLQWAVERITELEKACESCYDAQQRGEERIAEQAAVIKEIRTTQRWNPGRQDAGGFWIPHFDRASDGMWIKTADVKKALAKLEDKNEPS